MMEYKIFRNENGCFITRDSKIAYTHFKVGDVIKHRLKLDNDRIIELEITGLNGYGVSASGYSINYERVFEENRHPLADDEILERLEALLLEDADKEAE